MHMHPLNHLTGFTPARPQIVAARNNAYLSRLHSGMDGESIQSKASGLQTHHGGLRGGGEHESSRSLEAGESAHQCHSGPHL
jgi:hypothetical protein